MILCKVRLLDLNLQGMSFHTLSLYLSPPQIAGIWWYQTHPIKKVLITGIVAGREERIGKYTTILRMLTSFNWFRALGMVTDVALDLVDDGTGIIPCVQWHPNRSDAPQYGVNISLGSLVRVRGRITEFRGTRQVTADDICMSCSISFVLQSVFCP